MNIQQTKKTVDVESAYRNTAAAYRESLISDAQWREYLQDENFRKWVERDAA